MSKEPLEKYKLLFDSAKDAIIILEEYKIKELNESAKRLFAHSEDELIGKPLNSLIPIPQEVLEEILKGKERVLEAEYSKKNGTLIEIEINLSKATFEGKDYIFAFIKDVTKRKRELKRLFFISIIDPLTGAYNRRYFKQRLEEEVERAKRTGRSFSLIMFDLDRFKEINDTYGHEVGDLTLKKVGRAVKERIRKTDIFARWGGEEFFILLPETDLTGAIKLAEDLRERISQIEIPHGEKVTASFGVTSYHPGDSPKDLRTRADSLLYKSKASGKNCISFG
ncbi:MAG: sensor domain-containing diguanylate cyclase [Synergistetes bacterium]|nr:sensor domain-containing diguanylate cyclase [Synergistota bacterium]MDW8192927.1 sensor domain-containing diguanylate cyclase [Synergistota bacterium]